MAAPRDTADSAAPLSPSPPPPSNTSPNPTAHQPAATKILSAESSTTSFADTSPEIAGKSPELGVGAPSPMPSPHLLSRDASLSDISALQDDEEMPVDGLTVFDLLDNLALPARLEHWQSKLARHTERVRRQQAKLRSSTTNAKDRVVEEWRRRVQPPDEQLENYRRRMRTSVDRVMSRWNDAKSVTAREKAAFIAGVLNIFVSGYLIGGLPQYFYYWFTVQFCYFMPIRFYTYHKRGYHYFLADMCYFVNLLLLLTIWVAPWSKRLFIATYCLANGNNAVAIAMWRNSLVFHSLDKVTSLFIHIMPPVTLHCMVHLTPQHVQATRFAGVYAVKHSAPNSPIHYSLLDMIFWSTVPYALWQLSYHVFISVRRRDKIAAGRPTSFTWLSKSYGKSWIGTIVLGLPKPLQEPAFMLTQYLFALSSMLPCPIWLWYRTPSAIFLTSLFSWSVYNGATYYIDVFGKRFQRELEQMKKDVARLQLDAASAGGASPLITPRTEKNAEDLNTLTNATGFGDKAGAGAGSGRGKYANNQGDDEGIAAVASKSSPLLGTIPPGSADGGGGGTRARTTGADISGAAAGAGVAAGAGAGAATGARAGGCGGLGHRHDKSESSIEKIPLLEDSPGARERSVRQSVQV